MTLKKFVNGEKGDSVRAKIDAIIDLLNSDITPNVLKSNGSGTSAPAATDDESSGYTVGSTWVDVDTDVAYLCVDATTDAAVWLNLNMVSTKVVAPTASDNLTSGYAAGHIWIRSGVDRALYYCYESTLGSASWDSISTLFELDVDKVKLKSTKDLSIEFKRVINLGMPELNTDGATKVDCLVANSNIGVATKLTEHDYGEPAPLTLVDGLDHVGQGTIVSTNPVTGHIIIQSRAGSNHTDDGKLFTQLSTDGGLTYSVPAIIPFTDYAQFDYRNTVGGFTKTGRFVMLLDKYANSKHTASYYMYSDDEGVTWLNGNGDNVNANLVTRTQAIIPDSDFMMDPASNHLLEWNDGTNDIIALPFYCRIFASPVNLYVVGIINSIDNGLTWTYYSHTDTFEMTGDLVPAEPTVVPLADGVFLMVCRNQSNTTPALMMQFISYDYGATWIHQGQCTFDSNTLAGSQYHLLPKMAIVNILGERCVAIYYTNRQEGKLKRIFAKASDLIGPKGHLAWNVDTLEIIHSWYNTGLTDTQDGNGCAMHYEGNFKGIYSAEDQRGGSHTAWMYVLPTFKPSDALRATTVSDVAKHLGIFNKDSAMSGSGAPTGTPYYVGQHYVDEVGGKAYIAKGTTSVSDWLILN